MRKKIAAAGVIAALSWSTTTSASAVGFGVGMTGGIRVYPDLGACAWVTSSSSAPFVGTFTAVGEMQGPGTRVGTVRASVPVAGTWTWSDCIPGAYDGATVGDGKYALHAHSPTGDFVEVKQCVVNHGVLACY